jgi:hypothetical protein
VAQAAAVQVAALTCRYEQRGVDEQLLEEARARVGRLRDPVALPGLDALSVAERDVAKRSSSTSSPAYLVPAARLK